MAKPPRPGARRAKKGPQVGTGGHRRKSLEGRGPTPKAEDRSYHPAAKRKAAQERLREQRPGERRETGGAAGVGLKRLGAPGDTELITGRNAVYEALAAGIPATALYIAQRIEMDARVRDAIALAADANVAVLEITRPELDRLTEAGTVHQGVALKIPPYAYADPQDLLERVVGSGRAPLLVALDGVTDPRNLGAIIRSVAAFGGQGVIVPQRRSAGVTAAAWKTSAGAAAHIPVAMAGNLTQTLKSFKKQGVFVIGLDGGGDTPLPGLELADSPLLIVVGSEGKGLSRLVTDTCDAVVSIPISADTESLNAGIATSVALYEVARLRAAAE